MTRKDYVLIAGAVDSIRDRRTRESAAVELSRALAADNPRFDSGRFRAACGADRPDILNLSHADFRDAMADALGDLAILAGNVVGPSDATWQDVAGTAALNLRRLARLIESARDCIPAGDLPLTFPSPAEVCAAV